MIRTPFKHLFFILVVVSFSACNWLNNETAVVSSNPTFLSLTFNKSDSVPALSTARFSLVWDDEFKDSVIVNLDSLPYQTKISKVIPKFSFYSTAGSIVYLKDKNNLPIDTIALSGTDTLDFNKVYKIKNTAADKVKERTYYIKVNVHKVQPELYQWNKVVNQIFTHAATKQKAVFFKNNFLLYVSSGIKNYLYTSTNATNWVDKSTALVGFPTDCNMREIIQFNSKLYVVSTDSKLYSSADGFSWSTESITLSDNNFSFNSLLYIYKANLWAIMKSKTDNSYKFATSTDAKVWTVKAQIPVNFPIRDFASIGFLTRNNLSKALVAGGYSSNGEILKNVWSTENGDYWLDFSKENSTYGFIAGSSIISYDNKLLLFGGLNNFGKVPLKPYLESKDEGLSWNVPDTINNRIQQMIISSSNDTSFIKYEARAYQSVISTKIGRDSLIYLIGGFNPLESVTYSDVWVGKLNRLGFIRK